MAVCHGPRVHHLRYYTKGSLGPFPVDEIVLPGISVRLSLEFDRASVSAWRTKGEIDGVDYFRVKDGVVCTSLVTSILCRDIIETKRCITLHPRVIVPFIR